MDSPIILFDGVCNFCNASVNFILQHDPKGIFRFAPLQSEAAKRLLEKHRFSTGDLNTMVLVEEDNVATKSTAALRIARRLRRPWPILAVFFIVPRFLRDFIYEIIAKNRYRWFGKKDACMIPAPEWKNRFLSDGGR